MMYKGGSLVIDDNAGTIAFGKTRDARLWREDSPLVLLKINTPLDAADIFVDDISLRGLNTSVNSFFRAFQTFQFTSLATSAALQEQIVRLNSSVRMEIQNHTQSINSLLTRVTGLDISVTALEAQPYWSAFGSDISYTGNVGIGNKYF